MSKEIQIIDLKKLKKVSTYAAEQKKSDTWIYTQIKSGKLKSKTIDGVIFVNESKMPQERIRVRLMDCSHTLFELINLGLKPADSLLANNEIIRNNEMITLLDEL